MSTSDSTTLDHAAAPRGAVMPKLGSLLAFAPLGVWTTWHLWENLWAFKGAEAWESRVTLARHPVVELLTSAIVLLPLVLHTIWGIRRMFIMRPNLGRYRFYGNLKFIVQRLTALGLLAFLPAHIWLARIDPQISLGRHEAFTHIAGMMHHHTPTLVVYILGILGTAYHLGNGLATGGMTWGYAASPRAMQRMNVISIAFFLILLGMGWGAVYALWSQGADLPPESAAHEEAPAAERAPLGPDGVRVARHAAR